jgi:AraC family transcriptional regulator
VGKIELANTYEEISRIQVTPPPLVGQALLGDTQLARPWVNTPIDAHVRGMEHHVLAAVMRGDGTSNARIDGRKFSTLSQTGTVTIVPKGRDAYWRCTGSPICSNVYLGSDRLQRCADEVGRGGRPELRERINANDPKLFGILSLIAAESSAGDRISKLYLEQLVDLLCLQLLREHVVRPGGSSQAGGLGPWQVRRISEYMQEHLDETVGLQDLADLIGLSRFHLCTAFRRATGFTPHQWLVRIRMDRARQLLADPRLTVTEVALAVGYQTPSSFTQAFRHCLSMTPTQFRQQLPG